MAKLSDIGYEIRVVKPLERRILRAQKNFQTTFGKTFTGL
jgi:hypothetical protein